MPLVWFVVAVVGVALVSAGVVYGYTQYATHLTVTGINWQVFLNNTSMGYVFHSPDAGCQPACPTNAQVNSVWTYRFVFVFGTTEVNLSVVNMTLPAPFQLLATQPQIPLRLPESGSLPITVSIQLPSDSGAYSTLGSIWID